MNDQRLLAGPKYLTVEQIAQRLQVQEETVRGWLRRGQLAGSRIGGRIWRVTEEQLAAMMRGAGGQGTGRAS